MVDGAGLGRDREIDQCVTPESLTPALCRSERLYLPHRKRVHSTYVVDADGHRALRIDYGRQEVTFDEPHLFAFGEQLVSRSSFTGDEATTWGPGYRWDEIAPLLEALLSEGIIKRGAGGSADPRGGGLVPSLVPPSTCPAPRAWTATECEAITRDLAGRAVEFGYLEVFVPVFRIAHPALDMDDRQVGEANVFPPRLRLDRDTEWRVCQYPGSRYQDDSPMNVTALRAMIKHWKPMMATLRALRGEFRARLVAAGRASHESDRRWTIGDLHSFSCVVLAVPAFALRGRSAPAQLHPVLSSVFRITDGIRMTTYEMLLSIEHPRRGDEPLTAAELYDYAEHEAVLIGDTGVCAGPRPMIEEFLATVIDGTGGDRLEAVEVPAEVRDTLAQLPRAVDYGLHGLAVWGLSQSIWLEMSRAHERLRIGLRGAAGPQADRLRARLDADWIKLERMQITSEHGRDVHRRAYEQAYDQAVQAVRTPVTAPTLAGALAPRPDREAVRAARGQLAAALTARRLEWSPPDLDLVLDAVLDYICAEQAVLAATIAIQRAINELLGQPAPTRDLEVRDFLVYYLLSRGRFPYLFDALDDELQVTVSCTASTITIVDRQAAP